MNELETACPVEFCLSPAGVPCRGLVCSQVPTHPERTDPELARRMKEILETLPPMRLVVRRLEQP